MCVIIFLGEKEYEWLELYVKYVVACGDIQVDCYRFRLVLKSISNENCYGMEESDINFCFFVSFSDNFERIYRKVYVQEKLFKEFSIVLINMSIFCRIKWEIIVSL